MIQVLLVLIKIVNIFFIFYVIVGTSAYIIDVNQIKKGGIKMTVLKNPESTSLVIEIENGVDSKGSKIYRKKVFSNVNVAIAPEDAYAVAIAIASVLQNTTRDYILKDNSKLVNQG